MTPQIMRPTVKIGHGIQNKTPLLGKQIQSKLQNPVRMDDNAVQHRAQKAFVLLRCCQAVQMFSDICFQAGSFVAQQLPLAGGVKPCAEVG